MPICIGYKNANGSQPWNIPLTVQRNIDSNIFWGIMGNSGWGVNMVDLEAVYSLPNVRLISLERFATNVQSIGEDVNLVRNRNFQKLEEKYPGLFQV